MKQTSFFVIVSQGLPILRFLISNMRILEAGLVWLSVISMSVTVSRHSQKYKKTKEDEEMHLFSYQSETT